MTLAANQPAPETPEPALILDALHLLRDVETWDLAPARWPQVEHILIALEIAWNAQDRALLLRALEDLELCPVRVQRIGSATPKPPPKPVLEVLSRMVHSLAKGVGKQGSKGDGRDSDHR